MTKPRFRGLPFLIALLLPLSAHAAKTPGESVDDTGLATSVKTALISDKQVDAGSINVETYRGVVQLGGFVESESERNAALNVATDVKGAKQVLDAMVVLDQDGILDVDDLPPELMDEAVLPAGAAAAFDGPLDLVGKTMDEIERWAIEQTLQLTSGNREEAARILGIGARTLYRKLDKYQSGDDEEGRAELAAEE